ncbi:Probable protein ABIL5 [Linum grandiflorum]
MDSDHHLQLHQPSQFLKSLQELKELRSQLHNAAAYCERSFLNSNQKNKILDSTKEYICSAVVTVVDHLGSVSANLNTTIADNASGFSEAELRIDSLKQRFLAYELYAQKIALTRTRWIPNFPKSQPRYLSTPGKSRHDKSSNKYNKKVMFEEGEELPLFFYTYSHKPSSANPNLSIVPVRDTITAGGKAQRTSAFHFQQSSTQHQQHQQHKKNGGMRRPAGSRSGSNGDIMSLVRRSKTAILKA